MVVGGSWWWLLLVVVCGGCGWWWFWLQFGVIGGGGCGWLLFGLVGSGGGCGWLSKAATMTGVPGKTTTATESYNMALIVGVMLAVSTLVVLLVLGVNKRKTLKTWFPPDFVSSSFRCSLLWCSGDVVVWWCGAGVMWWCGGVVQWCSGAVVQWWCGAVVV